ncbi:MAG: TIGR00282 family metallophosphoesterase [Acidobacteriota bacterium]|jgi:2',3'-cyclic-nucleotide 2'-phosphodiesterase
MKILFLGDIVGRPGRRAIRALLPDLTRTFLPDVIVANAENAAGGFGINQKILDELFQMGIHVITTGNHVWDKRELIPIIDREPRLIRPMNYVPEAPGKGAYRMELPTGGVLWVINLQGKILMPPIQCPFRTLDHFLETLPPDEKCVLVDFHAEATSEKRAMGFYFDGRVSLMLGTHTHVPTADAEILEGGTGYITDVGMTGPYASVIGMDPRSSIERMLYGMPTALNVAKGKPAIAAVFAEVDEETGRCLSFESRLIKLEESR